MSQITPLLMFNDQLDAALRFHRKVLPESELLQLARAGEDGPVQSAKFVLAGQRFKAFNGGPHFSFSDGLSLFVDCVDPEEVDRMLDRDRRLARAASALLEFDDRLEGADDEQGKYVLPDVPKALYTLTTKTPGTTTDRKLAGGAFESPDHGPELTFRLIGLPVT